MNNMKTFVDLIHVAQDASGAGSRAVKINAIEQMRNSPICIRMLVEGMSPYRVFGVKKFKSPKVFADTDSAPELFFDLLDNLHDRDLTGNAARGMITEVLSKYTSSTSEVLKLVLNKDLKAGFSADTVNEVLGDVVPSFGVMLAGKVDEKFVWVFPLQAEVKYDGTRSIAICEDGVASYVSRSGKPTDHLMGLFDDELAEIEKRVGEPIVVDGEALASSFTETINAKKKTNQEAKDNLNFYAFDIMTLREWKAKECNTIQTERSKFLAALLEDLGCKKIIKSGSKICYNYDEVYAYYLKVTQTGGKGKDEGLIIKKLDALYEWDRSKSWMKWKPVYTYDGKITGFYPGEEGSKYEHTLGGVMIEGEDENGVKFANSCGSGFDDDMRDEIFNNQDKYLGATVELEGQELTLASGKTIHAIRFPIFKKFRTDK